MKKSLLFTALSGLLLAKVVDYSYVQKLTLKNNLELKAKKLTIDKAEKQLLEARGYDLGKFIFREEISRSNNALYVFGMKLESREAKGDDLGIGELMGAGQNAGSVEPRNLNYPAPRTNFKTLLFYEIPLFTAGKLRYAQQMAALQIQANRYKYAHDKTKLLLETIKAYNGAVAAKEAIKALLKAKETTVSFVRMIKNYKRVGMATQVDLLQAQKRYSEVKAMLVDARNKYALALAYLRFLTDDYSITGVKNFQVFTPPKGDLKTLQAIALKKRNDLKWMQKNVETMRKKVKMDSAVKYPSIGGHFEYGWNDNVPTLSGDKDFYTLAVRMDYNIFNEAERAKIEYSKVQALQTSYYYRYMQKGIKLDVEKKYLTLKAKEATLRNKIINKNLAEEILRKYTYMYKQGMINMTILLMKESELRKARAELIKAKYDKALAAAELRAAVGELNEGVR